MRQSGHADSADLVGGNPKCEEADYTSNEPYSLARCWAERGLTKGTGSGRVEKHAGLWRLPFQYGAGVGRRMGRCAASALKPYGILALDTTDSGALLRSMFVEGEVKPPNTEPIRVVS